MYSIYSILFLRRAHFTAPPTLESSSERAFHHSNRVPVISTQSSLPIYSRGSNSTRVPIINTQARQFDSRNVSGDAQAPVISSDRPSSASDLSHYNRIVGSLNSAAAASSALQTVGNNPAPSHPAAFEGRSSTHPSSSIAVPFHPPAFEGRSSTLAPPNLVFPAHACVPPNNVPSSRPLPLASFESCRPPAFEDTYTAEDPFYGCFHEGSEVKSNYDDSTVRAKILLLPAKLRTFKGIKQHVKELIKSAPKPKEYVISIPTIMAFLRCNFVNGLAVHVVKVGLLDGGG